MFDSLQGLKRWIAGAATALALSVCPATLPVAQADDNDDIKELRQRLEVLEKQNKELNAKLEGEQPTLAPPGVGAVAEIRSAVEGILNEKEAKAKEEAAKAAKAAEDAGHKVGSDLKLSTRWNYNNGFTAETANKDFAIHIGGRMNFDTVFWDQDAFLKDPGQVGTLDDGMFFRRARINIDGRFWEVFEFDTIFNLEQVNENIVNLDDFWVGITKLPVIGNVRIGHHKTLQGLESLSSSRVLTFMERSALFDAFWVEFQPGVVAFNNIGDNDRATWGLQAGRVENFGGTGADFGDGEYVYTGRLTALPVYTNEGRCLVHVGGSAQWRKAERLGPDSSGDPVVRFRARPEMRDAVGNFGSGTLPGNNNRWVDTGNIEGDAVMTYGAEFLAIMGPLSLQAEATLANVRNAELVGSATDEVTFSGYYVTLSYFLTGENRAYDKRLGRLASNYVTRIHSPFWFVRDEDGNLSRGCGAWEVAARYSYVDLNDDVIAGGKLSQWTVGLNWYLCPNMKMQFQYLNTHRFDVGSSPASNFGDPQFSGDAQGFGIRTVLDF